MFANEILPRFANDIGVETEMIDFDLIDFTDTVEEEDSN